MAKIVKPPTDPDTSGATAPEDPTDPTAATPPEDPGPVLTYRLNWKLDAHQGEVLEEGATIQLTTAEAAVFYPGLLTLVDPPEEA